MPRMGFRRGVPIREGGGRVTLQYLDTHLQYLGFKLDLRGKRPYT